MDGATITVFLIGFGLIGATALALLEKLIPIVPSYAMLLLLGSLAPNWAGLAGMLLATVAGSVAGAFVWYGLGRALGSARIEGFVARYGRFLFLTLETYTRLANSYRRNQFWATLIGQTVPGARVYLALPAGVLRLEPYGFLIATILGTIAWNLAFLGLGYALRGSGQDPLSLVLYVVIGLLALEFAAFLAIRYGRRGRAQREPG